MKVSKYLDFNIIAYIRDYKYNEVARRTKKEMLQEIEQSGGLTGIQTDSDKVQSSPKPDGLERTAIKCTMLKESIHELDKYFERFDRAYAALSEEEKIVIDAYKDPNKHAIYYICEKCHCERAKAYRIREASLMRFASMLF